MKHSDQIIVPRRHIDSKKTQNQYFSGEDSYFSYRGSNVQLPSIHLSIHPSIFYTWLTIQGCMGLN